MSTLTDWLSKELANIESGIMGEINALEPALKQAALITLGTGISAVTNTAGTLGQKLAAGVAAVETTAKSLAPTLETTAVQSGLALAIAANSTLLGVVTPTPAAPVAQ